eukprot:scpid5969/ scgid7016/ Proteasome-associated protein ECM29 homolog
MSGQEELLLLERVLLRFGGADTDEKLEKSVGRFLCPVLLKLGTERKDVRDKTLEVLTHISKQLKNRLKLAMPVDALLQQYEDSTLSSFVHNFTVVYLKMALVRITRAEQLALVPRLLCCLEGRPVANQNTLLRVITPLLGSVELPESQVDRASWLMLRQKRRAVGSLLLEFLIDFLRLPYKKPSFTPTSEHGENRGGLQGLTHASYQRASADLTVSNGYFDKLEEMKLGAVEFIASGIFAEEDVACHLLVASADTHHSVADKSDSHLKRMVGPDIWEKAPVITAVYKLLLGSTMNVPLDEVMLGSQGDTKSPTHCSVARDFVLLAILTVLQRSKEAVDQIELAVKACAVCHYSTQLKIRIQGLLLLQHICEHSSEDNATKYGASLFSYVCERIMEDEEPVALRSLALIALGKFSRTVPEHFRKRIHQRSSPEGVLRYMFKTLEETESEDLRQSFYDCIMAFAPALVPSAKAHSAEYMSLLASCRNSEVAKVRLLGVQFAITVLGVSDVATSFVLLEHSADSDETVRRACQRAIYGVVEDQSAHGHLTIIPSPEHLTPVEQILQHLNSASRTALSNDKGYRSAGVILPFSPKVLQQMLLYCHAALLSQYGITQEEFTLGNYQRQLLETYTSKTDHSQRVAKWTESWQLMEYLLAGKTLGSEFHVTTLAYLADLILLVPRDVETHVREVCLPHIMPYVTSSNEEVRGLAARVLASCTICCSLELTTITDQLMAEMHKKDLECKHGAMLALGAIIAGIPYSDRASELTSAVCNGFLKEFFLIVCGFLDSTSTSMYLAACQVITDIASTMSLEMVPDGELEKEAEESGGPPAAKKAKSPQDREAWTKAAIVQALGMRIKKGMESKILEKSSLTLASLLVGDSGMVHRQYILDKLLSTSKMAQAEVHFVVGEALSSVAVGRTSTSAPVSPVKYSIVCYSAKSEDKAATELAHLSSTLSAIMKLSKSDFESSRQAACVWLLCIVKDCGSLDGFKAHLREVQDVFVTMLTERNDIVQEVASRGLSLMFEYSPAEERDQLLETLRETLLKGRRSGRHVDKKTKVLDADVIGKQPDSSNPTTYEELCAMADDLQQPNLVYKFMNLANHHAIWNSKKGAAFGVSLIAQHDKEALQEHMDAIVPKLYTYGFDPNVKVQLAMANIWKALVTEPLKMIAKHFAAILAEIIGGLTHVQWRTRQSSCLALSDLLRRTDIRRELVEALPFIWEQCMRVRDDIKESVREAADSACKSLSKVTVRICDSSRGENGKMAIATVLPVIMDKGMLSSVAEVKTFSLATILQIAKSAGDLLKPHIAKLIPLLLEGLTELEPKVLSYVALHVGAENEEMQDKLDTARISASKGSPLMDVANQCLYHIDKTVLDGLIPALVIVLKSGVGLSTKAGCAQFIVSLCNRCGDDITPYAGKLLAALLHGLASRSSGVRRSYATCTGHVVKNAKESSVAKLVEKITAWYIEKDEEELQISAALALHAMSRHSPDVVQRHSSAILPLVFLAMHAKTKPPSTQDEQNSLDTVALWKEIWQENTPGTEGGVRVNHSEIMPMLIGVLNTSSSWDLKRQSAAAMSTVATKLGTGLTDATRDNLMLSLISALDTHMWKGRHAVYQAATDLLCVPLSEESKTPARMETVGKLLDSMLAQCKKKRYKREAVQCCGQILSVVSLDRRSTVSSIVAPIIEQDATNSDSDDGATTSERESQREQLRSAAFTLAGQAWPKGFTTIDEGSKDIMERAIASLEMSPWRVRVAILNTVSEFCSRCSVSSLAGTDKPVVMALGLKMLETVCKHITDAKFTAVQSASIKAVDQILQMSATGEFGLLSDTGIKQRLHQQIMALLTLRSASVLHPRCKDILQKYFS